MPANNTATIVTSPRNAATPPSTASSVAAPASEPMASITCCRQGVAPTSWPALRSCKLSPATEAALHTTAPISTTATAPMRACSAPSIHSSTSEANRMVQMVMPETGLLDEPTRPAM